MRCDSTSSFSLHILDTCAYNLIPGTSYERYYAIAARRPRGNPRRTEATVGLGTFEMRVHGAGHMVIGGRENRRGRQADVY